MTDNIRVALFTGVILIFQTIFITGCGGLIPEDVTSDSVSIPADISGYRVSFTTVDPGNTGNSPGDETTYYFNPDGTLQGTGPGGSYTATSWTWSSTSSSGTGRANFGGGAYETYTIYSDGTCDYTGFDGWSSYYSYGNCSIY